MSILRDLASRIQKHLKRFEKDPGINTYGSGDDRSHQGLVPYYWANSFVAGRYVGVVYIAYQGASYLTKEDAAAYLARLDAGFVGRHQEALALGAPSKKDSE